MAREIERWVTFNGRRIPIFKKDSKSATIRGVKTSKPQTMSWVEMVQKYDLQNTKRPYIDFSKVVTIHDAKHIPQSFNISKGLEKIKALNEAVVNVEKGMYKKRVKQLQDAGFKIESTTPYNEDAQPWQKMNMFVTRKVYKMKK